MPGVALECQFPFVVIDSMEAIDGALSVFNDGTVSFSKFSSR
jgi:hypothetical protein